VTVFAAGVISGAFSTFLRRDNLDRTREIELYSSGAHADAADSSAPWWKLPILEKVHSSWSRLLNRTAFRAHRRVWEHTALAGSSAGVYAFTGWNLYLSLAGVISAIVHPSQHSLYDFVRSSVNLFYSGSALFADTMLAWNDEQRPQTWSSLLSHWDSIGHTAHASGAAVGFILAAAFHAYSALRRPHPSSRPKVHRRL
jgi:hypothetical protein